MYIKLNALFAICVIILALAKSVILWALIVGIMLLLFYVIGSD